MNRLLSLVVLLLPGLMPAGACAEDNTFTIGSNADLVAGARALQFGQFEQGIERTLAGLRDESSRLARARAYNNLCAGYAAIGDYVAALNYCDLALNINPNNWRVYNNRAIALLGAGRIPEARRALEKGLSINPGSPSLAEVSRMIEQRAESIRTAQLS